MASGQKDVFDPNKQFPNVLLFMENSMLGFLQALFSSFPAGHDPRAYHYDDNPDLTEIEISGQGTDNLKNVDTRPKIVVARGPVGWSPTHAGNFVGSKNLSMETRKYARIDSGSIGISCFSREDLEADHLAQICYDSITAFQYVLQRFGFLTIKAAQIGQRGLVKVDSRPDLSVTPVLVRVEIAREWTTSKLDPVKMRHILYSYVTRP